MTRNKRLWIILSVLFFVLFCCVLFLNILLDRNTELLSDTDYKTGLQNNVLAYDIDGNIMLIGTYNNVLVAFQMDSGEKLWEMEANGPFRKMIIHADEKIIYAGNEDNHVYLIDMDSGTVLGNINVQRRIYDIDVKSDGSEIAISAGVNTAKHNIMIYSHDGTQISNKQYKTQIKGVTYTHDESNLIIVNNRGEIILLDNEYNELDKYTAKYEFISLIDFADKHLAMCSDGSYYVFDDQFTVYRNGKPNMIQGATATAVGTDEAGKNIIIGTKEGYMYVLNENDEQIYEDHLDNTISGFAAKDALIYITGYGDFVKTIDVGMLKTIATIISIHDYIKLLVAVFAVAAVACVLIAIPWTNQLLRRIGKALCKHKVAYILLIPTFVLLLFFNYVPVAMAFTRAFTNWSKYNNSLAEIDFVGLDNFKTMISEGYFLTGLRNLGILLLTGFAKVMTIPILVAWLVYSLKTSREKYIFRFLFVLPIVVPTVVGALLWLQIYDPTIGLLNQILGKVGLESWQRVWLGSEKTAIWAIVFMGFPFVNAMAFLVYYGGLTSIDHSLYEAARIDGATRAGIFAKIQLPMIMPQIKLMVILTFIGTVQDFTGIYLLTGGGPGTSTYVPGLELYYNATTFGRYGYACALGIVMFIFIMLGTLLNMRIKAENN